jgi:hypothetical protein
VFQPASKQVQRLDGPELRVEAQCLGKASEDAVPATLKYFLQRLRDEQDSLGSSRCFRCSVWDTVSLVDIVSKAPPSPTEIDALDEHQQTALQATAARKDMDAVRIIVAIGADIHAKNSHGRTAAECIREGYSACSDLDGELLFVQRIRPALEKREAERSKRVRPLLQVPMKW